MSNPWSTLDYWQSGEYQAAREKINDEIAKGFRVNPDRRSLFRALSLVPEAKVRVAILGQDPYPQSRFATGVAFSIPSDIPGREFPPTLKTLFREYQDDLRYTCPTHGNLEHWCTQGVLLWNVIPSCREGASLSHDWKGNEWGDLTAEIVRRLSDRGIVFAFLGAIAKRFLHLVDLTKNQIIYTSHPSPRGSMHAHNPFLGSRMFSCINDKLNGHGLSPIDWRLDGSNSSDVQPTELDRSRILDNTTGVELPGLVAKARPNTYHSNFEAT
jgi:uracil-DNA glycosylase